VPVTGAIADRNPANKDWLIIGAAGQTDTVQDHAKLKLAYDISPVLRASYTLGWWGNDSVRQRAVVSENGVRSAGPDPGCHQHRRQALRHQARPTWRRASGRFPI
jgi:iron complex outermembrane receptor protein